VSNTLLPASSVTFRVSLIGLLIWGAALALMPAALAARILLLAPLVIVPRLLTLLPDRRWVGRAAGWPAWLPHSRC
jgi:hypothetical protein